MLMVRQLAPIEMSFWRDIVGRGCGCKVFRGGNGLGYSVGCCRVIVGSARLGQARGETWLRDLSCRDVVCVLAGGGTWG